MSWNGCFLTKNISTETWALLGLSTFGWSITLLPDPNSLELFYDQRGWSDPTPKAQTENIWLHFQHGYKTNWNQGAKSTPHWTENKILQPRPISGHYFSWKVDDTVSIESYYRRSKSLYSETTILGEKQFLFFKKTVLALSCLCLPACISKTAAHFFPWASYFTKYSEAVHV